MLTPAGLDIAVTARLVPQSVPPGHCHAVRRFADTLADDTDGQTTKHMSSTYDPPPARRHPRSAG